MFACLFKVESFTVLSNDKKDPGGKVVGRLTEELEGCRKFLEQVLKRQIYRIHSTGAGMSYVDLWFWSSGWVPGGHRFRSQQYIEMDKIIQRKCTICKKKKNREKDGIFL